MKYKVELAEFHTIEVEAADKIEAEEIAATMDDEEILERAVENSGMVIWGATEKGK